MTKKNLILATATLIALTSAGVLDARAMQTSGESGSPQMGFGDIMMQMVISTNLG